MSRQRISWNPAFYSSVQLELAEYNDYMEYIEKKQLTTEPLRIDLLVIKKAPEIKIDKNFGKLFRGHNILEYKSPSDSLTIEAYHKAMAYIYLYLITNKCSIDDITLTFISSRNPQSLQRYLVNQRKLELERKYPGITYVHGEAVPVQIINRTQLGEKEPWLRALGSAVSINELKSIADLGYSMSERQKVITYMKVLLQANSRILEEVSKMDERKLVARILEVAEETGVLAERLERGKEEGRLEGRLEGEMKAKVDVARSLLQRGMLATEVAEIASLPLETIKQLEAEL